MKMAVSTAKAAAKSPAAIRLKALIFLASPSFRAPSRREISVPPPIANRFDSGTQKLKKGRIRDAAATIYGFRVRPMKKVSARL